MEKENKTAYSLTQITTEQFAIMEDAFTEKAHVELQTKLRFAFDPDRKYIVVFAMFNFKQNNIAFIIIESGCHFAIQPDSWNKFLNANGTILTVPQSFMSHLASITVGTTRGILHAKTEGTIMSRFLIPPVNLKELIKEDIDFVFVDNAAHVEHPLPS